MDLDTPINIEITPGIVFAIAFLLIAFRIRRQSVDSKRNWDRAWDSIAPSLNAGHAPFVTASRGITGCATWIIGWFFVLLFIALAVDFAVSGREGSIYVWEHLAEWTEALVRGFIAFLRALARALL